MGVTWVVNERIKSTPATAIITITSIDATSTVLLLIPAFLVYMGLSVSERYLSLT